MALHEGSYPALLLNADFRPVSVFPLSTMSWQEALKGVFMEKVVTVAEYRDVEISSARARWKLPSVVALREYVRVPRHVPFTRANLWIRDGGRCAYCGQHLATEDLTFDHVWPKSRGGVTSWENIACSCVACNTRKGNRSSDECGMHPAPRPVRPSQYDLARKAKALGKVAPAPKDWVDFVYWDGELMA